METSNGYSTNYQYSASFAGSRHDVTYRQVQILSLGGKNEFYSNAALEQILLLVLVEHFPFASLSLRAWVMGSQIERALGQLELTTFQEQMDGLAAWAKIEDIVIRSIPTYFNCGSCGYDLNLNSSSRNTSTIGSKYNISIKKGIISFLSIDESRFNQVEELSCVPNFISKYSWGFLRSRTKLLCRKCGNHIGVSSDQNNTSSCHLITNGSDSPSSSEISNKRKYDIRIRSLQPSSAGFGTPLIL